MTREQELRKELEIKELNQEELIEFILDRENKAAKNKEQELICSTCGFPKNMLRNIVILENDIFSLIHHEENTCEGCGHQKTGWTIPVIQNEVVRPAVEEAIKLTEEEFLKKVDKLKITIDIFKHKRNEGEFGAMIGSVDNTHSVYNAADWERLKDEVEVENIELIKHKLKEQIQEKKQ